MLLVSANQLWKLFSHLQKFVLVMTKSEHKEKKIVGPTQKTSVDMSSQKKQLDALL